MNANPNDRLLPVPRRRPSSADERFALHLQTSQRGPTEPYVSLMDRAPLWFQVAFTAVGLIFFCYGIWDTWQHWPPDQLVRYWAAVGPGIHELVDPLAGAFRLMVGGIEFVVLMPVFLFGWAFFTFLPLQIFCWFLLVLWVLRKPWRQLLSAIRSRA